MSLPDQIENSGPPKPVKDIGIKSEEYKFSYKIFGSLDRDSFFVPSWQIKKKLIDGGIPANKIHILDSDEVL